MKKVVFILMFIITLKPALAVTIGVDLAHGENPKGLAPIVYNNQTLAPGMVETLTQYTFVYFGNESYMEELGIRWLGRSITPGLLESVDVLIIGQPTVNLSSAEVSAIRDWFYSGGKVLWIAGDSDYGSGVVTQGIVNYILKALNAPLRIDLCSVEDPVNNAGGRAYRLIAYDRPSKDTPYLSLLTQSINHGILAHGPGPVALYSGGEWKPLRDADKPPNVYIILRTGKSADIVENNPPKAKAYSAGETGEFPIVAAWVWGSGKRSVLIVSGETPIGGYEPMWVGEYYNITLDGPRFVSNVIHWAVVVAHSKPEGGQVAPQTSSEVYVPQPPKTTVESKTPGKIPPLAFIVGMVGAAIALLAVGLFFMRDKKQSSPGTDKTALPGFPRELLDRYEPLEFLGEGGFAKVFKVRRKSDGKVVALKIPHLGEKSKKSFLREVKAWSELKHENIVKLYRAEEEPIPHLEIEFVDGINLNGEVIRDLAKYPKPVDEEKALRFIGGIARGLAHAHSKGIIHRDLKPQNVLIASDLTPKITDWGLAKVGTHSTTTAPGLTVLYAAPEQLDPETYGRTDHRTDIYQLGLIFYELLTGTLPYGSTSPAGAVAKILNPEVKLKPPSAINPELAKYDRLFEKLLAKRKEDRYGSVEEFLRELTTLKEIESERDSLREQIDELKKTIQITTDRSEVRRLVQRLVATLGKNAVLSAELNDKAGLISALEELKEFTQREKEDIERAIETVELLMREGLPLSDDLLERIRLLVDRIEREVRGER